MKKKYIRLFIFLIFMLFCAFNVSAKVYQCEYQTESTALFKGGKFILEFDSENGTVKNLSELKDYWYVFGSNKYIYNYHITQEEIEFFEKYKEENNSVKDVCPIIYVAVESSIGGYTTTNTYYFFSDGYLRDNGVYDSCPLGPDGSMSIACIGDIVNIEFTVSFTQFFTAILDKDSEINSDKDEQSFCNGYTSLHTKIKEYYIAYSECSGNHCRDIILDADKKINELKNFCSSILQYRDVFIQGTDDKQDTCIAYCLNLSNEITTLKTNYGLIKSSVLTTCGFSKRLLVWLSNILRWVKYIVPVIVIIFGILDFIKAVGADKDDEMKKAQGRFVKRLIAAALIFIVPLILEFVLDKMGFGYDTCGLF